MQIISRHSHKPLLFLFLLPRKTLEENKQGGAQIVEIRFIESVRNASLRLITRRSNHYRAIWHEYTKGRGRRGSVSRTQSSLLLVTRGETRDPNRPKAPLLLLLLLLRENDGWSSIRDRDSFNYLLFPPLRISPSSFSP